MFGRPKLVSLDYQTSIHQLLICEVILNLRYDLSTADEIQLRRRIVKCCSQIRNIPGMFERVDSLRDEALECAWNEWNSHGASFVNFFGMEIDKNLRMIFSTTPHPLLN